MRKWYLRFRKALLGPRASIVKGIPKCFWGPSGFSEVWDTKANKTTHFAENPDLLALPPKAARTNNHYLFKKHVASLPECPGPPQKQFAKKPCRDPFDVAGPQGQHVGSFSASGTRRGLS